MVTYYVNITLKNKRSMIRFSVWQIAQSLVSQPFMKKNLIEVYFT